MAGVPSAGHSWWCGPTGGAAVELGVPGRMSVSQAGRWPPGAVRTGRIGHSREALGRERGRQSRASGPWCPGGRVSVWSMCDPVGQDLH